VLHEDERSLHVHGGYDKLMMAGVAGEAAIADAAHAAPLLHRDVSAIDAGARGWPAKFPRTVFSTGSRSTSLGRDWIDPEAGPPSPTTPGLGEILMSATRIASQHS
jgi:hypothetical protein